MFGRFDRRRAHAARAAFPRHLGIRPVVARVGVTKLFQRKRVLAREYADECLALVFVVEVQTLPPAICIPGLEQVCIAAVNTVG